MASTRAASAAFSSDLLDQANTVQPKAGQIICLTLAHNEVHLLADFLSFYRALGNVHFLFVDDRSDDGSAEYLAQQPDVSIFVPTAGSTYAQHKRHWRSALLDHFADGAWAIVPDIDERLLWRNFEIRPLADLIADLEAEAAEGLYCTMVDMYRDGGLADQVYDGELPLAKAMPLYDDPRKDPASHRLTLAPSRFRKSWPTPAMIMQGGMRDRLFFGGAHSVGPLTRLLPTIRDPQPTGIFYAFETAIKRLVGRSSRDMPRINLTKIPLLKWRKGLQFYGGAHALSEPLKLASETAVMLHFPITKGEDGVRYIAARGQHVAGGAYYQKLLEPGGNGEALLRYAGTSRFESSADLDVFMRPRRRG